MIMLKQKNFLITLTIFLCLSSPLLSHHCKDEDGNEVEWFISMRLVSNNRAPREYGIIDSRRSSAWRQTTEEGLFTPLFKGIKPNEDGTFAWNDKNGNTDKQIGNTFAHSKGLLVGGKNFNNLKKGFILSHSIPGFPTITDNDINPVSPTNSSYGQHAICITLTNSETEVISIIGELKAMKIPVYYNSLGVATTMKPYPSDIKQFTLSDFQILVKSQSNRQHIYSEILFPHFKNTLKLEKGLFVESWGRPYIVSECLKTTGLIDNVTSMEILGHPYTSTQDHAKWVVSMEDNIPLVCFSDLNNMESQHERGGLFLCFQNQSVYQLLRNAIKSSQCLEIIEAMIIDNPSIVGLLWQWLKAKAFGLFKGKKPTYKPSASVAVKADPKKVSGGGITKKRRNNIQNKGTNSNRVF